MMRSFIELVYLQTTTYKFSNNNPYVTPRKHQCSVNTFRLRTLSRSTKRLDLSTVVFVHGHRVGQRSGTDWHKPGWNLKLKSA